MAFFKEVGKGLKSIFGGSGGGQTGYKKLPMDPYLTDVLQKARTRQSHLLNYLHGDIKRVGHERFKPGVERLKARRQTVAEQQALKTAGEDRARRTKQLIAQRGLGGTSTGLSALANVGKETQQQRSMLRGLSNLRETEAVDQAKKQFEIDRFKKMAMLNQMLSQTLASPGARAQTIQTQTAKKKSFLGSLTGMALGSFAGAAGESAGGALFSSGGKK